MRIPALLLLAAGASLAIHAQAPLLPPPGTPLPEFAAATIKPGSVDYLGVYVNPGGRVSAGQCTLRYLLTEAFHVSASKVLGGPRWIDTAVFDIEAVPPDDSPARKYNPVAVNSPLIDNQRLMLQALLRDRFQLKYHVEKREQPVFFLQRTGKPLKLLPPKDPNGFSFMGVNIYSDGKGNGEIEATNATMTFTALRLSAILESIVIDCTGLTGAYDFHVNAPDEANSDIRDATFQGFKSLGLELKPGKAPVDTIVIESVSKPTPN